MANAVHCERPTYAVRPALPSEAGDLFSLINESYAVESGTEGVAFKCTTRLGSPSDLSESINERRCLVAVNASGALLGCIVFNVEQEKSECHFGPFAVAPHAQGRGVGSALMWAIDDAALSLGTTWVGISVVNHRSDILPMYRALGFVEYGTEPYPERGAWALTRPTHMLMMRRAVRRRETV